ncbi:MAG: SUMF1/EgtB/PvdO family nonheme iron enzyme [Desulfamplus sp.]|nr:SUMF1/EgtB/PvdO family nonheme iron enzyme [Desulfamplus sp.]
MNPKNMCMGCMADKKSTTPVCPLCGYDESERRSPLVLKHRTLLADQYVVGKVLGKPGGFGITYLGWDTRLETMVAIKEYLPRDNAGRDTDQSTVVPHSKEDEESFRHGLKAFMLEARTLAKFNHASVVRVRTFFEGNGTAYLVMDYYNGMSLESYLIQKGGKIPEKLAVDIMMPILDGLREVHEKGFLHRDIKPHNIYLTEGNLSILLDFGAARFAMGERSRSLSVFLTHGYAPYEQYQRKGKQGTWTDIYAAGATLYRMVTGRTPLDAADRKENDELVPPNRLAQVSTGFTQAVMKALSMEPSNRPQSVREFQDLMFNVVSPQAQTPPLRPEPQPSPPPPQPPPRKTFQPQPLPKSPEPANKSPMLKWVVIGLVVAAGIFIAYSMGGKKQSYQSAGDIIDGPLPNMKFAYIPAGTFMMGSPVSEPDRINNETQYQVRLTEGFFMQTTEVTQGQWKAVMGSNPSKFSNCGDNCPMESVSWEDAQKFINKLNQNGDGRQYRLPTEAEWEYACRAGTTGAYSGNLNSMGWYGENSGDTTHPVAQKQSNAWNLYDMHGNVWEWCQDWYGDYVFGFPPETGSVRVVRGGSWNFNAYYCRSAYRGKYGPSDRYGYLGFRVVCSAGHQ